MGKKAGTHGRFLSGGAEPCKKGAWGPALLGLSMNEPGKEADTEVTASHVFKSCQKNVTKLLSNEMTN